MSEKRRYHALGCRLDLHVKAVAEEPKWRESEGSWSVSS